MHESAHPSKFDPDAWDGDPEFLRPFQDELALGHELCDQTFASRREAFAAGLELGSTDADGVPNPASDLALTAACPKCISCSRTTDPDRAYRAVSGWETKGGDYVFVTPIEHAGCLCSDCLEEIEAGIRPRPQWPGSGS
jgi:hypothetical protein